MVDPIQIAIGGSGKNRLCHLLFNRDSELISRAFGTQSEEFKVMPTDCKTCLHGDKLFQDREVAITTLHCFQAGAANNHMAVPWL